MQLGEKKGRFVHKLKVANRSFSVAESSPGASVSAAPKRAVFRTGGIPKGGSPWRAFGDFPRDGKVTRGGGAERLHWWVLGLPAPHKLPRGAGRSARSWGAVGAQPPLWGAGAKSDDLLPRGLCPLANPPAAHGRGRTLFLKKIRRPRHLGKLPAALPPVREKPLHLPPEGGAVVVM